MTMEMIRELRTRTNLGLADCKSALAEANGDMETAIEILQKKGLKKVDDFVIPLEGVVRASVANFGVIIEVNCQTDFAARSNPFNTFIDNVIADSHETLGNTELVSQGMGFVTHKDLPNVSRVLGEKIVLRRRNWLAVLPGGMIRAYNHLGGKIAVLVSLELPPNVSDRSVVENFADDVAMHIAAAKPLRVSRESFPADVVNKKKAFFMESAKDKREALQARIVDGKMDKWYAEFALLEQESMVHPKKTIQQVLDETIAKVGPIKINRFIRFERGEMSPEK